MTEPDLALSVKFRLPREGVLVQVWFAGQDQRWSYATRYGDVWHVDSREIPSDMPVTSKLITHWRDAPPEPGIIDKRTFFDSAADVILESLPVARPPLERPARKLRKK